MLDRELRYKPLSAALFFYRQEIQIKSMKPMKQLLTVLIILLSMSMTNAQTINCSDFSILGFGPDQFNSGNSVVHIHFGGDTIDFIDYPFISVVTDCNGDTIATGNMNFFGQTGQTVQSYPVTGNITNACLPITVEFIYGNINLQIDTCTFSLSSLATALTCNDFVPNGIEADQSNTLINISMQGSTNAFIANPRISTVTDCVGDTIATGFINTSGQIGQSAQGYPITSIGNTICYPITIEFIFENTDFEVDTCFLSLDNSSATSELSFGKGTFSIFPNPMNNEFYIHTNSGKVGTKYLIYDFTGKLMISGMLASENTHIDISNFLAGIYFIKMEDNLGQTFKIVKQ